jgi:hypothetical protein
MNNPIRAESREPIPGETWCTHCKVPVDEWVVEFVRDSEGYAKQCRCPNCGKPSFDGGDYCNFIWVLLIVGVALWVGGFFAWFWVTGTEPNFEGKGDQGSTHEGFLFFGAMVFSIVFTLIGFPFYKSYIRRHGPKGQPKKPRKENP